MNYEVMGYHKGETYIYIGFPNKEGPRKVF